MAEIFYSTSNGKRDGRNGHFHRNEDNAFQKAVDSNTAATEMGIKARYVVAATSDKGIDKIRD